MDGERFFVVYNLIENKTAETPSAGPNVIENKTAESPRALDSGVAHGSLLSRGSLRSPLDRSETPS
ncbi:MAG: hypothetical protein ABEJ27_04980, partial [Halodesulfurarchaeum sp.]